MEEKKMNDYLKEVAKHLKGIPQAEQAEILDYYNEYILDAGMTDEDVVAHFGQAKTFARKLRLDFLMNEEDGNVAKPARRYGTMAWLVILGLFASPILLPIALAAFAVILSFWLVIFSLIISSYAVIVSLLAIGVFGVFSGIAVVFQSVASAFWFIGFGLVATGLAILIAPWLIRFTKWLIHINHLTVKWLGSRFVLRGKVRGV
jgi:uncharacterized membrane protein